ncbi:hypothetical protein ACLMJK_004004 [Lecanora helva]
MSQQQAENPAQSNSFYPSAQFPSPASQVAMAGQYSYPPPEAQGNSPSGSNMAVPSLSLPPIRSIDGQAQSQVPRGQQSAQAAPGTTLTPAMGQYYGQAQPYPQTSDPNAPQRWPLPPDGRVMSGGRHKKEIKRRTKTGCLTCRKRRIKCDEAHPSCRNCQKSKRECLGYDPIFKSQPGPTAIQPAAGGAPLLQPGSANTSPYPLPPQGSLPPGVQSYGQPGTNSENSPAESYDYGGAIDPALEGSNAAQMQDSKGALGTGSPYPQGVPEQRGHIAKKTKIEELLCLRGYPPPPPAPPTPLADAVKHEIRKIWNAAYAPGMDKFLETRWFLTRGLTHLMENSRLCNQFAALLARFAATYSNHPDPHTYHYSCTTQSLEATVVWAMMSMCRQVSGKSKSETETIDEQDIKEGVHDAARRLEAFETLITGEYLDTDTAPPPSSEAEPNGTGLDNQLKTRSQNFWSHLHTFLTLHDDEASSAKEIDDTLAVCRQLLDSRENRDVIYSIMIARHVGARMAEFFPNNMQGQQAESNDEEISKNKLIVAKKFIEDQEIKGTNQVVQRLCGMAVRSWSLKR